MIDERTELNKSHRKKAKFGNKKITLEDSYDAVGMLIQSKSKEDFPKIILVGDE